MPIQSRWSSTRNKPDLTVSGPPDGTVAPGKRPAGIAPLPVPRETIGRGRPAKVRADVENVRENKRQITSFYLHPELFDRVKAYLREIGLSQTEWLEYLIRTELARRGFEEPPDLSSPVTLAGDLGAPEEAGATEAPPDPPAPQKPRKRKASKPKPKRKTPKRKTSG